MKKIISSIVVTGALLVPMFASASTNFGVIIPAITPQPGISIQNTDGSWTLHAVGTFLSPVGNWIY